MTKNSWFSARLLFESRHPDETDVEKVFEDRIVLLEADDEHEAEREARKLGSKSREEYKNQFGNRVIWEFVELLDLVPLTTEDIAHGSELYSQFLDEQDLAAVRRSLEPGKLGNDSETA
jgi:hypothetical protein